MNKNHKSDHVGIASLAQYRVDGQSLGDKQISIMFRLVSVRLMNLLGQKVESYGLSNNGYIALMTLHGSPAQLLNPSGLSALIGESRGNMTRICDELIKKDLITRVPSPQDRRRINLSLSEKGMALVTELSPLLSAHNQRIYQGFSREEKASAIAFMSKLTDRLDEMM